MTCKGNFLSHTCIAGCKFESQLKKKTVHIKGKLKGFITISHFSSRKSCKTMEYNTYLKSTLNLESLTGNYHRATGSAEQD